MEPALRRRPSGSTVSGFAVRLWSVAEGTAAGEWIRGEARWALADMDLSPDGAYIVTSGTQGCYCARLWNATTGKPWATR